METIFTAWLLLVIVLCTINLKYGLSLYISYLLLVPVMNFHIGGLSLGWNFTNTILALLFIYHYTKNKWEINTKPLVPFFIYYGVSLFLILFQFDTPYSWQLNYWRQTIMQTMIPCFIIWNVIYNCPECIKSFRIFMIISIIISVSYGLLLTQTVGLNPYILEINNFSGADFNEEYLLAEGEGRIFGRISSCFLHPMTYALFLGLSMIYIFALREKIGNIFFILVFSLITASIFTCGVRSVIGGIAIPIIYYLLKSRKIKILIYASTVLVALYYIISLTPELSDYLSSILDSGSNNVTGSSLEMRLDQLNSCLDEFSSNILFGKGYGWSHYYMEIKGKHPQLLAFESLVFVVLCNSGICGVILWYYYCKKIISSNKKQYFEIFLNALLLFYLTYSMITGEYEYMKYYILFYVLLFGESMYNNRSQTYS